LKKKEEIEIEEEITIEITIVDDLTAVSGIRNSPSKQQLIEFVKKCSNVDLAIISEALCSKLESNNWIVRLRSLYGIESLIQEKKNGCCL